MESTERVLLLLQRLLSRGYAGRRQNSWRRSCTRDRFARGEVELIIYRQGKELT
jgi:hypothetical protein